MKNFNKSFFNVSENIDLNTIPKTFQPIYYVKIKDDFYRTDLPQPLNSERAEYSKEYNIKPSSKGYSFLLKTNKISSKRDKKISEYLEYGSVISLSLKPNFFKSDKVVSGVIDEKYYNIVKPLSDDLYAELKAKNLNPLNTDLVKVYELHIPVSELSNNTKTRLIRRYEKFEDYLRDLLLILETNLIVLENQEYVRSADVLYVKIQKIKKYLETGVDPEYEFSNTYSMNDLISKDSKIQKQREIGINKLQEYIYNFYPQNNQLIEVLENNIFEFNNKDYLFKIEKIKFIVTEFSDALDNYINKRVSFIELISMELPLIRPENDLPNYYTNPKETFRYLYSWTPNSEQYIKYNNELESVNNNIIEFKKLKKDLSDLEINEIYDQMLEYKQWEKSKLKLRTINIPTKKNSVRVMCDFLKKERNRLISRRIYRVAKINERIMNRKQLYMIFSKCNLSNFNKSDINTLCESIENIVYSLSNKPDIYNYNINLVKNTYKILCELITEPKVIVPIVTEFIIKEGNLKYINIERVNTILTTLNSDNIDEKYNSIIQLLEKLRHKELLAYRTSFIEEQNKQPTNYRLKLIQAINKVIENNKAERKEEMYSIAANTYISPIITNIIPKIQTGPNSFYVPEYYIIGENEYLYGGNFPDFLNAETNERNYTDDEIYSLAILLKIDYKEDIDIKELYYECINKLQNSSDLSKQVYSKQVLLDYNPTLITKKVYTSYVNYTYRERIGVKSPGEVYIVYIDTIQISYAVPFKYNEQGIPVYSSKFMQDDIKKYYYIEGPAEFEEDLTNKYFIHSTMYILVEYKDSSGKVKLFREGVNTKNVKKSPKEKFDACNRFLNEIDCNDLNSYGIEKMKCKFIKGKCVSTKQELQKQDLFIDFKDVSFKRLSKKYDKSGNYIYITDYHKTKLWNDAIKKSNNYIIQLKIIKNLNVEQLQQVAQEQKKKLTEYYNILQKLNTTMKLKTIIEDVNNSNKNEKKNL